MSTVTVASRLPFGLILSLPGRKEKVTLASKNTSKIIGATFATTEVDSDFWQAWKKNYADYQPYKSNAIFEAGTPRQAAAKAKELADEKTGFEPCSQSAGGVKPDLIKG